MEGNIEVIKETSQVSSYQKPKSQNQFWNRQYGDHHKARNNITKPTCLENLPSNASGEIEQHQPISFDESSENARLGQSHEVGVDSNSEKQRANRRRGQNSCRADKRFNPRQPSNQDRRFTNSNGAYENSNGKKQFTKGGSSIRGNTRGRGRGRSQGIRQGCAGENEDKRNGPVSNSHNMRLSPATATSDEPIAAKPNAWTDNAFPITKAFESSALKELLPKTAEEEKAMMDQAIKKSLEETLLQQKNYNGRQRERRYSNSSEEVCINEAEEAKKMLQEHSAFLPLPVAVPDFAISNPVGVAAPSSDMTQVFTTDQHAIETPGSAFSMKEHSNTNEATAAVWTQLGAIPKTSLSTCQSIGRGRKRTEGKIGELIASSGSVAQTHSMTSSAHAMLKNKPKPKIPQSAVDIEQFAPAVVSLCSKTDVGSCVTQLETDTRNVPCQDNVPSVDLSSNAVMLPTMDLSSNAVMLPTMDLSSNAAVLPCHENAQQLQAVSNAVQQMPIASSAVLQGKIVVDATHELQLLANATPQVKEPEMLAQQVNVPDNVAQQKTDTVAQVPAQILLTPVSGNIDTDTTNGGLQHCENNAMITEKFDRSKDEEIRALREQVNRLTLGLHESYPKALHFPPPPPPSFVSMPPYMMPTLYYHCPISGMAIPCIQNEGCMYDSSFPQMPYVPNGQVVGMQEMHHMRVAAASAICQSPPVISSSNFDAVDTPVLVSNLSPAAAEFYPRKNRPHVQPRLRYQNFNKRGNPFK